MAARKFVQKRECALRTNGLPGLVYALRTKWLPECCTHRTERQKVCTKIRTPVVWSRPSPWMASAAKRLWRAVGGLRWRLLPWVCMLVLCEHLVFHLYAARCRWPVLPAGGGPPTRLMLLADPQLTDVSSYKLLGASAGTQLGSLLLALYSSMCDGYLRRVWRAAQWHLGPWQLSLFMGDIFDGGRYAESGGEWQLLLNRFDAVFGVPRGATPRANSMYALGNHDVNTCSGCTIGQMYRHRIPSALRPMDQHAAGIGPLRDLEASVFSRHQLAFGPVNQVRHTDWLPATPTGCLLRVSERDRCDG